MCCHPITIRQQTDHGTEFLQVPCGHCVQCLARKRSEWARRLVDEGTQWQHIIMATFTYSEDNIPRVDVIPETYIDLRGKHVENNFSCDDSTFSMFPNYTADSDFFSESVSLFDFSAYFKGWAPTFIPSDTQEIFVDHTDVLNDLLSNLPCNKAFRDLPDYLDYLRPDWSDVNSSKSVPYCKVDDVQKFIKRVRRYLDYHHGIKSDAFKYWCCSEYGGQTFRPHYHIIFFTNCDPLPFIVALQNKWKLGFIESHEVLSVYKGKQTPKEAALRYVSKYVNKSHDFENPYVQLGLIPKPFRLMSVGIGASGRQETLERIFNFSEYCPHLRSRGFKPYVGKIDDDGNISVTPDYPEVCNMGRLFGRDGMCCSSIDYSKVGFLYNPMFPLKCFEGFPIEFLDYVLHVLRPSGTFTDKLGNIICYQSAPIRYYYDKLFRKVSRVESRPVRKWSAKDNRYHITYKDVTLYKIDRTNPFYIAYKSYVQYRCDERFYQGFRNVTGKSPFSASEADVRRYNDFVSLESLQLSQKILAREASFIYSSFDRDRLI